MATSAASRATAMAAVQAILDRYVLEVTIVKEINLQDIIIFHIKFISLLP